MTYNRFPRNCFGKYPYSSVPNSNHRKCRGLSSLNHFSESQWPRSNYWSITEANREFFANHAHLVHCPFMDGMNQLWRNQLLALSIEQDERQPYRHVAFSVVKHPRNTALDATLEDYQDVIASNPKFSTFTSTDVIAAASAVNDAQLDQWVMWYKTLYNL